MTSMPTGWKAHRLDELGFVGRGRSRHRPRNDQSLYGGPYPFIQTAEIVAANCYVTTYTQTYNEKGLAQSKMWDADTLCISIAGENTAETAILKFKACFPDSVIGFIPNKDNAEVGFVKYALDAMKREIKGITKGATQDNLSLEKLLSFDILTPPIATQRRISYVLSTYD